MNLIINYLLISYIALITDNLAACYLASIEFVALYCCVHPNYQNLFCIDVSGLQKH